MIQSLASGPLDHVRFASNLKCFINLYNRLLLHTSLTVCYVYVGRWRWRLRHSPIRMYIYLHTYRYTYVYTYISCEMYLRCFGLFFVWFVKMYCVWFVIFWMYWIILRIGYAGYSRCTVYWRNIIFMWWFGCRGLFCVYVMVWDVYGLDVVFWMDSVLDV